MRQISFSTNKLSYKISYNTGAIEKTLRLKLCEAERPCLYRLKKSLNRAIQQAHQLPNRTKRYHVCYNTHY